MTDERDQQINILAAKVIVLELIVRGLLTLQYKNDPNPTESAKDAAGRVVEALEAYVKGGPSDPATMLLVEQAQTFFDRIVTGLESN